MNFETNTKSAGATSRPIFERDELPAAWRMRLSKALDVAAQRLDKADGVAIGERIDELFARAAGALHRLAGLAVRCGCTSADPEDRRFRLHLPLPRAAMKLGNASKFGRKLLGAMALGERYTVAELRGALGLPARLRSPIMRALAALMRRHHVETAGFKSGPGGMRIAYRRATT